MQAQDIPYGYCQCGCGLQTTVLKHDDHAYGYKRGESRRYRSGHAGRKWPQAGYAVDEATGCWNWTGRLSRMGYGEVYNPSSRRTDWAHRVMYEKHRDPIPEGLVLDHLCRNPRCVNPAHLEPVTQQENIRRGAATRRRKGSVYWREKRQRWAAAAKVHGRMRHVGHFLTREEAEGALAEFLEPYQGV